MVFAISAFTFNTELLVNVPVPLIPFDKVVIPSDMLNAPLFITSAKTASPTTSTSPLFTNPESTDIVRSAAPTVKLALFINSPFPDISPANKISPSTALITPSFCAPANVRFPFRFTVASVLLIIAPPIVRFISNTALL